MQRINVTTCKVTGWASPQVIPNLFLSAFEIFLATSKCQFTYVWTNFKGSNSRFHGDFGVGLIVVAWPIEVTKKNEKVSHFDARRRYFRALFRFPRFLLRPGRSDRLQANSSTHPRRCGVVLSDLRPWSPWDHPIFLTFWVSDIEIDPKSIYCSYL